MAGFCGAQSHLDHVVRIELARYSDSEHSRVNSSIIHSIRNFLPLRVRSSTKSSVQTWSGHSGGKRTHDPRPARAASASAGAPAPWTPPAAVGSAALDHSTWPPVPHDHARRRRSPGKRAPRALPPGPVADGRPTGRQRLRDTRLATYPPSGRHTPYPVSENWRSHVRRACLPAGAHRGRRERGSARANAAGEARAGRPAAKPRARHRPAAPAART